MSDEGRRHLSAIVALVLGSFVGLTLLPVHLTGGLGDLLGGALWRSLGLGALGFPLLGLGLGLAGFDRLPRLDMKRTAILMIGLAVLVPFLIGVVTGYTPSGPEDLAARLTGWLPGFFAFYLVKAIGVAGGVLLGFALLSALTIMTIAWHPLTRLARPSGEATVAAPAPAPRRAAQSSAATALATSPTAPAEDEEDHPVFPAPPRREKKPKKPAKAAGDLPIGDPADETQLPPIELLAPPPAQDRDAGQAELDRLGQVLLETLKTFKVEGTIAGRTTGPVVTQFEVVPAPGVKVGRIASLADDMAITMRAQSIRVAPIPGKGAVGVEIPNPNARMVTLRELVEAPEWDASRAVLPIALGRDLEGKPVIADLAKMPHLLIAGATGSGKSVAINTIITSLVYRYTPKQLRFLMVDPKMVELSMYNALPHMRHKVVTNNNDAATVLKWGVIEMNRRYELLHANGARNLADFNRKADEGKPLRKPPKPRPTIASISAEGETTAPEPEDDGVYREGPLPLIVMIVDELADLMMTVQGEVETPLAILAQKARAIGIHLILATQRPSVNVLTGLIKANFPSRIAFRVASKVDSRTILDQNGAEALLGNGDMLFLPPGKSEPMRLQGAYIATEETERVMDWFEKRREARVAQQQAPAAPSEEDILAFMRAHEAAEEGGGGSSFDGERDPLFREAAEVCVQNQGGSTSLLQRRLSIGYGRAARIIDQLHMAGILGPQPPGSSKPREVLIGIEQIDEYCS
ncbi:MAG TPA: DNA translocase FtsK [Gemmatimonadales bacterium]|nr:DNA translocase FtsK [Gemmatimonadales bacterium]